MAGNIRSQGSYVNPKLSSFVVDTVAEIDELPTSTTVGTGKFSHMDFTVDVGSDCLVGNKGGDLLTYMLFGFGWREI